MVLNERDLLCNLLTTVQCYLQENENYADVPALWIHHIHLNITRRMGTCEKQNPQKATVSRHRCRKSYLTLDVAVTATRDVQESKEKYKMLQEFEK